MEVLLYNPEQAADLLNVSRSAIYELMRSGELESIKIGRSRRIPASAISDFVERQRAEQTAPVPA